MKTGLICLSVLVAEMVGGTMRAAEVRYFECPELVNDQHGDTARFGVSVPDAYDAEKPMPLLVWFAGGKGSSDPAGAAGMVDFERWVVAAMPYPGGGPRPRDASQRGKMDRIWEFHRAMLDHLFAEVPNAKAGARFAGGLSNGAHSVGSYVAQGRVGFVDRFDAFVIVEGGCREERAAADLGGKFCYLAWGDGEGGSLGYMQPMVLSARDAGLVVTARTMPGVGHGFPGAEKTKVADWIVSVASGSSQSVEDREP